MTKEELKELLKPTFAYDTLGETGSFTEGVDELVDVLVHAYNKALEDAAEIVGERGDPEWSWSGFSLFDRCGGRYSCLSTRISFTKWQITRLTPFKIYFNIENKDG